MEPDPIGLEGGLNPYIYANGNPVGHVDPSGLYAYVNSRGEWVENGGSFYSASSGAFTDRIAYNFLNDVATLAPLPKFNFLSKEFFFFEKIETPLALVNKRTSISNASESAYRASASTRNWIPKDKHLMNSTSKKYAKFNTDELSVVLNRVIEALGSSNATFLPNGISSNSYQIITNMNRVIGTKGQSSLKVIVDKNGKIWTAYPVK